ncbi:PAP2 superfamily protein [Sinosporangium album]|uniref:PAP2 superfamily protein n=1 Tax=Sinosporangium album TaxID=504805 RepID=A0A1G7XER7_9ACTN|nr:phosphatase PAP2 family protein [Sinosporangium album]SDG82636.1 PAP2 superfamily protein [Sinosporangium album]
MDFLERLRYDEIDLILWFQALPGWLEAPLKVVSALGTNGFVVVVLSVVYWCVNPRFGLRLGLVVLLSAGLNSVGKLLLQAPRPYWIDARVHAFAREPTFGIPSGHAQTATVFAGWLALQARKPYAVGAAVVFVALMAWSRLYLGVHFLSDVAAGILVGLVILLLVSRLEKPVMAWWRARTIGVQVLLALAVSLGVVALAVLASLAGAGWSLPDAWRFAGFVAPWEESRLAAIAGGLFGVIAGGSVLFARGGFSAAGSLVARGLRWLVGVAGAVVIWLATRMIAVEGSIVLTEAAAYLGYAALSLWAVLGAPLVFVALGLAERARPVAP